MINCISFEKKRIPTTNAPIDTSEIKEALYILFVARNSGDHILHKLRSINLVPIQLINFHLQSLIFSVYKLLKRNNLDHALDS